MNRKIVSEILGISEKSYYRWKEERKIFKLLEMYFSDDELEEFLEKGKIQKFDLFNKYIEEKNIKVDKYLDYFDNEYKSFLDYNDEIINIYMKTLVDYNKESFFIQFHTNILKINDDYIQKKFSFLLKDMIENDIIKILEEIVDVLVTSDFKILVERAWYESNKKRDESAIQYIVYNTYKYKKELSIKDKQKLILNLYKSYDIEYKNSKFYSENPNNFYKEVEKLKNN
jgi:hypothetical protein